MPLLIGLGVGAAAGGLDYALVQKPQYDKQLKLASQTQRYSPWTHMQATAPTMPNPLATTMQGAATGAAMGQGVSNASSTQALQQAQTNWLNSNPGAGYSPASLAMNGGASGMGGMGPSPWSLGVNTSLPYPTYSNLMPVAAGG